MAINYKHTKHIHNPESAVEILPFVFELVQPSSILDVGCGNGSWLMACKDMGITEVMGVDGVELPQEELYVDADEYLVYDLSQPLDLNKKFDLTISLEVAEHLNEKDADTFIGSLVKHADVVLFSGAIPGQGGQYHFNEQWPEYWNKKFRSHGFVAYDIIRRKFWNNERVLWWYKQNTMVYAKEDDVRFSSYKPIEEVDALVHPALFRKKVFYPKFLTDRKDVVALLKSTLKRLIKKR